MISYTMLRRKPTKWAVEFEGHTGTVEKNSSKRGDRWKLTEHESEDSNVVRYFKSRRAAFFFFEYGKQFETKPVYIKLGRGGGKRIR